MGANTRLKSCRPCLVFLSLIAIGAWKDWALSQDGDPAK